MTRRDRSPRWALAAVAGATFATFATPVSAWATQKSDPGVSLQNDYIRVVKTMRSSVVEISTDSGLGSGVVYDNKGDIVTNAHVVGDATSFTVTLSNGRQTKGRLLGSYIAGDLAVIRASSTSGLRPAKFANSSSVVVGDIVLAIGNPLGYQSSVTEGIVSANGRDVPESEGVILTDLVQTSAAINPGNSGGALVNLQSQIVGIPTLAAQNSESGGAASGIGFAIPASSVKLIAPQLIKSGKVTNANRAALGISGETVSDNSGNAVGVYVTSVTKGGAAVTAGIAEGDVITAINGSPVTQLIDLETVLAKLKPGAKATVTVVDPQTGKSHKVTVVLGQLTSS